jgi:hypothetical protein
MDPMGPIINHFESRLSIVEKELGIENSGYKEDDNSKLLDISVEEVEDIIQIRKNYKHNNEWNTIVKDIKQGAKNSTSPIVIYFNIQEFKKEFMAKLNKLGFKMEQRVPDTPKKDAVSYIVTIKNPKIHNKERNSK